MAKERARAPALNSSCERVSSVIVLLAVPIYMTGDILKIYQTLLLTSKRPDARASSSLASGCASKQSFVYDDYEILFTHGLGKDAIIAYHRISR